MAEINCNEDIPPVLEYVGAIELPAVELPAVELLPKEQAPFGEYQVEELAFNLYIHGRYDCGSTYAAFPRAINFDDVMDEENV